MDPAAPRTPLPPIENPFTCEGQLDVGTTPLIRMSSGHLRNSVRTLFGVDADVESLAAADERIGAFVSNFGSPVTDPVVDQYKVFAETVGAAVAARVADLTDCAAPDEACAVQFIAEFAPLTYRRPLRAGEAERLLTVYRAGGDFSAGIALLVEGMLQSPFFLYRIETEGEEVAPGIQKLTPFELATRLSFALVGSTPDRELMRAAESGALDTDEGMEGQIDRLLSGDLATGMFADFHSAWLGLDKLKFAGKDEQLFPEFSEELTAAMAKEVELFSTHVMQQDDARLETLMTASYSLFESPLSAIYGVEGGVDAPVALDAEQRSGILTLPAVLTVNADREHSSPVLRGIWVRENLLCQALPDPPDNVDTSLSEINTGTTTRERFEIHTKDPVCASCHVLIDPIGHGFENYDAIGRFRLKEGDAPVDASGSINGLAGGATADFNGALELGEVLMETVELPECVARQWFRHSLARMESRADNCSMSEAFSDFQDSDFNVKDLIRALVTSDAFRHTKGLAQ